MKKTLLLFVVILAFFSCQKDSDNYSITIYGRDTCPNTSKLRLDCYVANLNFEYLNIDDEGKNKYGVDELVIKYVPNVNSIVSVPIVKIEYDNTTYVFTTTFEMKDGKYIVHPNINEIKKLINK